jgi:hypothetical protein
MPVGDLPHIQAVRMINQDLSKVVLSPYSKSETRYVTPIRINLRDLGYKEDKMVMLVDSPGSQDTESSEVDIAN